MKIHSHPTRLALALALCFGSAHLAQAQTSLGEVQAQGQAAAATSGGFFLQAPAGTVGNLAQQQLDTIQQFNPDATQAQTTITAGQFQLLNPTDSFTQALSNMPNVMVVSTGSSQNGDNVYINGFNKSLINWTLDGIPLNDNDSYAFYSNQFIPTRLIAGTRYFPGAGSAAIPGLAAFGGSVETYSLNPDPKMSASLLAGYGSFGTYNEGVLLNSGLLGAGTGAPTAFWLYANKNHSDGYFDNTPSDQKQYLFKSVSQIGPGALTLFYSQNNQNFGYYGGCTAADLATYGDTCNSNRGATVVNGKPNPNSRAYKYNQYQNWLSYAKYEATFGQTTLSDQLYFYRGNGFGGGASAAASTTLLVPSGVAQKVFAPAGGLFVTHGINDTKRWGNILRLNTPLASTLGLEAGLWTNNNDTTHDSRYFSSTSGQYLGSSYVEPVTTKLVEPYFNLTWNTTPDLVVQGGLKYLKVSRDFTNDVALAQNKPGQFNNDFSTTMPSLGVNYKLAQGLHAYANYTENTQPPQYNQYYTGTYNPNLNPQQAKTYDMGLLYQAGIWSGGVDVFRVDFQNYILSTNVTLPSGQQGSQLQNAGSAVNEGIAWQNNFRFSSMWSMYANLGLLNAQLRASNKPFPYAPHQTLAVGGIYTQGPWRASLGAQYAGESYYVYSNGATSPIQAHTLANASLRYTFDRGDTVQGLGLQKLTVSLNVDNLLDKTYNTSYGGSSSNPYVYLNMPRSYYLSLEARF